MNLSLSKGDDMFDVTVLKKSMLNFIDNTTEIGSLIYRGQDDNASLASNNTEDYEFEMPREFIFDRKEVRIIFITLYSLVFCCCFFGECQKQFFYFENGKSHVTFMVTVFTFRKQFIFLVLIFERLRWQLPSPIYDHIVRIVHKSWKLTRA